MKKYHIIYEREGCVGCGGCVNEAPEFWTMNAKDKKADLKGSKDEGASHSLNFEKNALALHAKAARSCSAKVIHIYKEGKELPVHSLIFRLKSMLLK
jgi:ferredoxin